MPLSKIPSSMQAAITGADLPTIPTGKLPTIPTDKLPTGNVLQTQYSRYESAESYSINGATFGSYSGLTCSITPTLATSKIWIFISLDGLTWTADYTYGSFRIHRFLGATDVLEVGSFGYPRNWSSSDNSSGTTMTGVQYDSPATTSTLTYKFKFYSNSGTSTFNINRDTAGDSSMTLMEIKQ